MPEARRLTPDALTNKLNQRINLAPCAFVILPKQFLSL
jgi:hypothetical protein